jgi:hypothetical protein
MCGVDDQQTPDGPAVPRVIDRLRAVGLSDERIIQTYFRPAPSAWTASR